MLTLLLLLALTLLALAVLLATGALTAARTQTRNNLTRIRGYGFPTPPTPGPAGTPATPLDRLANSLGALLKRALDPKRERALRSQLHAAGLYTTTPQKYIGYRLLLTASLTLGYLWAARLAHTSPSRLLLGAAAALALGWIGPSFIVKRRARKRLERIDHQMPELVDLLVTAVEGGLSFAAALQLAARNLEPPLGQELRLVLQEQAMGLTINEALTNTLARADTAAIRAFVQAITQGETLGVSIGKILRDLALDMRKRRRHKAEEQAHKAPTKMLFPLIFLIFPPIFIVALGPILIQLKHGFLTN